MLRYIIGIVFSALTTVLCWGLDGRPTSSVPLAFGRFLDPSGGFWQNAEREDAYGDLELESEYLKAPVSVVYDQRRVAHIYAENDPDLYFAQGYVTARDRLWQMEFQIRAAGGRLSEIIDDERVLYVDRENRRRGMRYAAENALVSMESDPIAKMILDSYTAGANAYIESLSPKEYPFEYKLLNYAPEPWSNFKTCLLLKYMAWMLTGRSRDFEKSNALMSLGWERYCEVNPFYSDSISPIIPPGTAWDFDTVVRPQKPADSIPAQTIEAMQYLQPDAMNGSNNWALSGKKTKNGHPILCNDPHLSLSFPSIWYEVSLNTPEYNCYGVSLPGSPAITIGFNSNVAWGITNSSRDVQDWYRIEFQDEKKAAYRHDGQWKEVKERVEEIGLWDGSIFYDTVRYTHHGPVVYDAEFGHQDGEHPIDLAMRWTAHEGSYELLTFYYFNRAKNEADYRKALTYYSCPGQNFVFAAQDGDIAITQQGKYPNKWEGQGLFVMDGSNPDHDWKDFIPTEHNPYVKNPPRGFVSSANQHPADTSYPYRIDGIYEWNRSRRINQALAGMEQVTIEDMQKFQYDSYHQLASEVMRPLLAQVERAQLDASAQAAYDAMDKWNLFCDPDEVGPPYFQEFEYALEDVYWQDRLNHDGHPGELPPTYLTIHHLATTAADSADSSMKILHARIITEALDSAAFAIENWKVEHEGETLNWENYNAVYVQHLSRQKALSRYKIRTSGNAHVVNATRRNNGASWRMIVELGPEPVAYGVYPGGQSGNPGSKWYDSNVDTWAAGNYFPLEFYTTSGEAQKHASSTLSFQPAAK